jgi:hypothetical protein
VLVDEDGKASVLGEVVHQLEVAFIFGFQMFRGGRLWNDGVRGPGGETRAKASNSLDVGLLAYPSEEVEERVCEAHHRELGGPVGATGLDVCRYVQRREERIDRVSGT